MCLKTSWAGACCFVALAGGLFGHEFTGEEKAWWAVQPVKVVEPPAAEGNPVDGFVMRKLAAVELEMAGVASGEEFVRRAYFDLLGLPPSEEQVGEFLKSWERDQDSAVAGLVDELLASPRYGERWATHWLDVVRFSESDGYREDAFRATAYFYRDYVVKAFNEDKPYDEFVREQLAADELTPDDPDRVAATGFLRHGVYEWNQRNAEMQREIMINEITNVTGEVFLGLGVGCAQCHDHKFDPILQRDYFALQAFLSSTTWPDDRVHATKEEVAEYEAKLKVWEDATVGIRAEMEALVGERQREVFESRVKTFPPEVQEMYRKPREVRSAYEEQIALLVTRQAEREVLMGAKPEQVLKKESVERLRYDELTAELQGFDGIKPKSLPLAFMSTDTGVSPAVVTIPGKEDEEIEPQFLTLLGGEFPKVTPGETTTGRRSALADWIVREDHPLTARVMVNRIWQHHFGTGLAASPNDFGMLGEPPTHPELLDWMARKFAEGGWLVKPMHRLIMTSQAYRQTARYEPSERENLQDPANRLLWRFPPRRLSAEEVRDAMLAISGELKQRAGGASQGDEAPVRSVFVKKMRNTPNPVMQCFDAPAGFSSEPSRLNTTTATQSLLLANSPWPRGRAMAMAKRLLDGKTAATGEEIARGYRMAWGRDASQEEIEGGRAFLEEQLKVMGEGESAAVELSEPVVPLVPLAGKFQGAEAYLPAEAKAALALIPDSERARLVLSEVTLKDDHFTISAVVNLERIYPDGMVNTLISQWNGDQHSPGWAVGVTSEQSRYQPRNFIVQLTGHNPGGDVEYEVVASNLRVPLNRPVFLSAVINPLPNGKGTVRFFLKDLSVADAPMQTALVEHNLAGSIMSEGTPIIVGGRSWGASHQWRGQVARLTLRPSIQGPEEELQDEALIDLVFSEPKDDLPFPGTALLGSPKKDSGAEPAVEAFADFCQALLSSNEFLYLH